MEIKLVKYGSDAFDMTKFQPVKNRAYWNKPLGGLWASPINSKFGWKEWCEGEQFQIKRLSRKFLFRYSGNVIKINCLKDAAKIQWRQPTIKYEYSHQIPDFEQMMSIGIDAIWLTKQGESATRYNYQYSLYGWDCESVLIMNPNGIIPIKQEMSSARIEINDKRSLIF